MNICNIYRTVLIYLLLCYGKKFINGDGIIESRQNSPELSNSTESTQQQGFLPQSSTTNLISANLNSNNNDNINFVQAQLGVLPTVQAPAPSAASQGPAKAQGHTDIPLESSEDTDAGEVPQSVKRRITQKTGPEEPTSGSEIELDVPLDPTATQKLSQTTSQQPPATPSLTPGARKSNTLEGTTDQVILDLSERYTTDKVTYEYKADEQSHFYRPIPPNKLYHVKLGETTAWKFSGTGDHPLEVRVVPDADGNPKVQVIFPQYIETETETEAETPPAQPSGPAPPRVMPRPAEPVSQPPQAPQLAPQSQPTVQLPQTQLSQPQPAPPMAPHQPMHHPQHMPPQHMPTHQIPPQPMGTLPAHHPPPAKGPIDGPPGYAPSDAEANFELISLDIKQFVSTQQIDYFYYENEKIHKFLCKPSYRIGVLIKDGKIKKTFTSDFPNRVLIMKDENGAPLLRPLCPVQYDPKEPRYLPQQFMPTPQMSPHGMDPRFMDPRMMDLRMRDPRMMDPRAFILPRPIPIQLNTDSKCSTREYTYEQKDTYVHLYKARPPFLFANIRNDNKVLLQPSSDKLPDKVIYADPPDVKPSLKVAYPDKPPMPPPHMMQSMMPMHPGMRGPPMPRGPPPPQQSQQPQLPAQQPPQQPPTHAAPRHGPQVKVTEEVTKTGVRTNLVAVDINRRVSTDQIRFTYDTEDDSYVFTTQSPYFVFQVLAGREVLWVAKRGKYAEEIRVNYDENGVPNIKVVLPEFEPEAPPTRLPRPPEPAGMVPGAPPVTTAVPEEAGQLVEVDITFFHSTNEIVYRYYPKLDMHKFICRPGFMISKVLKSGKLKKEFTSDFPNRVLIMRDITGASVIRLLGPEDFESQEPPDPEIDKYFEYLRSIAPPIPVKPVPVKEAPPEEEEAPPEEAEEVAEFAEDAEVAEEEVPEEHVPITPEVDYSELVGTQLFLNINQSTDKIQYTVNTTTGARVFMVKDKYAFSSVKIPKSFSRSEFTIWKASDCEEYAHRVTLKKFEDSEIEEVNIYQFNGISKRFVKSKKINWKEIDLSKDNPVSLDYTKNQRNYTYYFKKGSSGVYVSYEAKPPFLFNKIYKGDSSPPITIWETENPQMYVKKLERDRVSALSTIQNMSLFFVNGRVRHYTLIKVDGVKRWVQKSPHIDLDIANNESNLYYTYDVNNGFGTFTARNNVTFITVRLGSGTARVNSFVFSRAPYGKFCKKVITNIHFCSQRAKFVSVLFNDGKHNHFVSPINTMQWQKIPLEVELNIQKRIDKYQFRYLPYDQLPSYMSNYNFIISRIMQDKTQIWKSRDNVGAKIIIMDDSHDPKQLAVFLNNGNTIYFRKSDIFWSSYSKFIPLHLELENRKTTSCILYKYDNEQKMDVYTPRNGLVIKSVSNQNRMVWSTNVESEFARKVVVSETKLTIFQSDRKRLEFDTDLPYNEDDELLVIDPQYGYHE